jgi:hypothetical protein
LFDSKRLIQGWVINRDGAACSYQNAAINEVREESRRREQLMEIEDIASKLVAAAMKVHTALGPGLLESAYQKCLAYELTKNNLKVECEVMLPIKYEDVDIDAGYRIV